MFVSYLQTLGQPTPVFLPGEPHGQRSLWGTVQRSQRVSKVGQDWSDWAHSTHHVMQRTWASWGFGICIFYTDIKLTILKEILGLSEHPGLSKWYSGKESACQCRRHKKCGFDLWVEKIPWSRKWQPTPVFLPGKCHGKRSLLGYSPWVTRSQTQLSD